MFKPTLKECRHRLRKIADFHKSATEEDFSDELCESSERCECKRNARELLIALIAQLKVGDASAAEKILASFQECNDPDVKAMYNDDPVYEAEFKVLLTERLVQEAENVQFAILRRQIIVFGFDIYEAHLKQFQARLLEQHTGLEPADEDEDEDEPMLEQDATSDWNKSDIHRSLLYQFVCIASTRFLIDYWHENLGEPTAVAIACFKDEGYLRVPSREELLLHGYDIDRVYDEMAEQSLLICTEKGASLALADWGVEGLWGDDEKKSQSLLYSARLVEACWVVARYEASQDTPRAGVDWKNYSPIRDVAKLKIIFSGRPKLLIRFCDNNDTGLLRVVTVITAMNELWGKDMLRGQTRCFGHDFRDSAVHILSFYANHQAEIDAYRKADVENRREIYPQFPVFAALTVVGIKFVELMAEDENRLYYHVWRAVGCPMPEVKLFCKEAMERFGEQVSTTFFIGKDNQGWHSSGLDSITVILRLRNLIEVLAEDDTESFGQIN